MQPHVAGYRLAISARNREAIVGLELRQRQGLDIWVTCRENLSRFRPGTRIVLHGSAEQFCGLVVHIDDSGTQLQFRMEDMPTNVPPGKWIAAEAEIDLSPLVLRCLRMLQPGAPGWSFCQTILGGSARRSQTQRRRNATEENDVIEQVLGEAKLQLDATQRETVAACVDQPPMLAVQGPPGTGKTVVLAIVAEILASLGRRVLVTAPTHQATNNALATIRRHFPSRRIVKVGDDVQRDGLPDDIQCLPLSRILQPGSQHLSATIVGMTFLSALQNVVARKSGFAVNWRFTFDGPFALLSSPVPPSIFLRTKSHHLGAWDLGAKKNASPPAKVRRTGSAASLPVLSAARQIRPQCVVD